MKLSVVILAAGKGTRMYSDIPKVLHAVAGKPLLEHIVDTCQQLSPQQIIAVHGYKGDRVQAALSHKSVQWVKQEEQLGTGHAVLKALSKVNPGNKVLILCGDAPLIQADSLCRLVNLVTDEKQIALMTAILLDATGYGRIVRNTQQQLVKIVECKDTNSEQANIQEINTGIYCVPQTLLQRWLGQLNTNNSQGEYYLTDIIAMAVNDDIAINTSHPSDTNEILGANNRLQLTQIERIYQFQQAQNLLAQGVTLYDPNRFDCRGNLSVGKDVTIDVNVIVEGNVKIGNGCKIGANVILKNVELADGVEVHPFSHLEHTTVASEAVIGPYARLRPGSEIGAKAKVGNFVEIKKSRLGEKSKVNHLSYIGDAVIGEHVNIGAGVITCNYDGVHKYQTRIDDGAFIGSDSQLVAPVSIGKGAFIAAGSTITKDAPEDKLSIARAKQITITSWKKPQKKEK